jgi:transcriptional regulator with XRE-family HTH domain
MDVLEELLRDARARRSLPDPAVRRLLRERAGLTQDQLANVLGVGRVAVTRYESGLRTPRGDTCVKYALLLERLAKERSNELAAAGAERR